jgi:hypothetical protein
MLAANHCFGPSWRSRDKTYATLHVAPPSHHRLPGQTVDFNINDSPPIRRMPPDIFHAAWSLVRMVRGPWHRPSDEAEELLPVRTKHMSQSSRTDPSPRPNLGLIVVRMRNLTGLHHAATQERPVLTAEPHVSVKRNTTSCSLCYIKGRKFRCHHVLGLCRLSVKEHTGGDVPLGRQSRCLNTKPRVRVTSWSAVLWISNIKYQIPGEGGDNEDDGARVESEYQEKVEVIKIMERGWRTRVPKRTPSQTNKVVG